jgi:hypothetical protein
MQYEFFIFISINTCFKDIFMQKKDSRNNFCWGFGMQEGVV